jgi:hypothetical protein
VLVVFVGQQSVMLNSQLCNTFGNTINEAVDRVNFGGGWFMTRNILAMIEYNNQTYKDYKVGSTFAGGQFNGFVIEAVIAF